MNHALAVERWNRNYMPGTLVEVTGKRIACKTISVACVQGKEASVYVDGFVGPVPLKLVRPVGQWAICRAGLVQAGYRPGNWNQIDADAVTALACDCGMLYDYLPFNHPDEDTYRAFGVCPKCGKFEEF